MKGLTGLMDRLVALKQRLDEPPEPVQPQKSPTWHEQLLRMEQQLSQLRKANGQAEQTGNLLEPSQPEFAPPNTQTAFSWRLRRLLLQGKEIVDHLRKLAPRFVLHEDVFPPFAPGRLFEETLHAAEFSLRIAAPLPSSLPEQDRLADGLQATLQAVGMNLARLQHLAQRWETEQKQIEVLGELLRALIQERPVLWIQFEQLAEEIIAEVRDDAPPLRWFPLDVQRPQRWAAAHGLNTAQVMARVLPHDAKDAELKKRAVLAALLHDAGMAAMPPEMLRSPGPLSDVQRQELETHVGLAADALRKAFPQEEWLAEVVRAHHERLDGCGYPTGAPAEEIPALSRWLALCDTYAALSTPRLHRRSRNARTALTETLLEAEKGRLDATLAEHFLSLTFYPPGTVVELSDGSIGLVENSAISQNGTQVGCRPVVLLHLAGEGKPLPEPLPVDLARATGRHIVRSLTLEDARRLLGARVLDLW